MQPLVNITRIVGLGCGCVSGKCAHSGLNSDDIARFWAKVHYSVDGCWEWTASRAGGRNLKLYGQFTYNGPDGQRVHTYAHRIAWSLANGPVPDGLNVLHKCDNGICARPDHLFLGTHTDNMQDASAKGRLAVPRVRNRERIAEIRRLWLNGDITQAALAVQFQTSDVQISRWLKAVKQRPYERRQAVA